ncbi:class II fructose-bisphosphate aldolase [Desulfohalobium retbaense]|nr:class II fructose-bisphosphate aldolase [Desulfohalobium retbaense]
MSLVESKRILTEAKSNSTSVGCFSVYDFDSISEVISAAEFLGVPLMLSVDSNDFTPKSLKALGLQAIKSAEKSFVSVAVHLNHAKDIDAVLMALDMGFSSVMYDGSNLPFYENMKHTRKAACLAHASNSNIEGELGDLTNLMVLGNYGYNGIDIANEFIAKTNIDFLALTIPKSGLKDVSVLSYMCKNIEIPIAIHGASRIKENGPKTAAKLGASKINFHSEIKKYILNKKNSDNKYRLSELIYKHLVSISFV